MKIETYGIFLYFVEEFVAFAGTVMGSVSSLLIWSCFVGPFLGFFAYGGSRTEILNFSPVSPSTTSFLYV